MNQRQLRASIRQAKRTGQPFQKIEVGSCNEAKELDKYQEWSMWDRIHVAQMGFPDKRKIKHLKSKV